MGIRLTLTKVRYIGNYFFSRVHLNSISNGAILTPWNSHMLMISSPKLIVYVGCCWFWAGAREDRASRRGGKEAQERHWWSGEETCCLHKFEEGWSRQWCCGFWATSNTSQWRASKTYVSHGRSRPVGTLNGWGWSRGEFHLGRHFSSNRGEQLTRWTLSQKPVKTSIYIMCQEAVF